jgi:hypothetical protein
MRNFKSRRGILQYRGILVLLVQQVELGLGTSKLHPEDFIFDSRPDIEEWNLDGYYSIERSPYRNLTVKL